MSGLRSAHIPLVDSGPRWGDSGDHDWQPKAGIQTRLLGFHEPEFECPKYGLGSVAHPELD